MTTDETAGGRVRLNDGLEPCRRAQMQPALHMVARELCLLDMTDGFCEPRRCERCTRCWPRAEELLRSSRFSARALCWILIHRSRIEDEAAKGSNAISPADPAE